MNKKKKTIKKGSKLNKHIKVVHTGFQQFDFDESLHLTFKSCCLYSVQKNAQTLVNKF